MKTDSLIDSDKLIAYKLIAYILLISGTLIFLMFLLFSKIEIGLFGLLFLIVTIISDIIVILILITKLFIDRKQRRNILKTLGLVLVNLPVAILYCWISIAWINTLRITFINNTPTDLYDIKIVGCENDNIEKLLKGDKETVWINIPNDCGVSINYRLNGVDITEDVTGYVSNESGYSMTFKIGTNQKPYDQDF